MRNLIGFITSTPNTAILDNYGSTILKLSKHNAVYYAHLTSDYRPNVWFCYRTIFNFLFTFENQRTDRAQADIVDIYAHFDLPYFWGTGAIAGADGTQFDSYRNNLKAESHIRYGGYGVMAYHHISDTYIALFSHFIACGVWEAVYILDGLLKNRSEEIQPQTVHADTGSV